jgi:hypothetical protein
MPEVIKNGGIGGIGEELIVKTTSELLIEAFANGEKPQIVSNANLSDIFPVLASVEDIFVVRQFDKNIDPPRGYYTILDSAFIDDRFHIDTGEVAPSELVEKGSSVTIDGVAYAVTEISKDGKYAVISDGKITDVIELKELDTASSKISIRPIGVIEEIIKP